MRQNKEVNQTFLVDGRLFSEDACWSEIINFWSDFSDRSKLSNKFPSLHTKIQSYRDRYIQKNENTSYHQVLKQHEIGELLALTYFAMYMSRLPKEVSKQMRTNVREESFQALKGKYLSDESKLADAMTYAYQSINKSQDIFDFALIKKAFKPLLLAIVQQLEKDVKNISSKNKDELEAMQIKIGRWFMNYGLAAQYRLIEIRHKNLDLADSMFAKHYGMASVLKPTRGGRLSRMMNVFKRLNEEIGRRVMSQDNLPIVNGVPVEVNSRAEETKVTPHTKNMIKAVENLRSLEVEQTKQPTRRSMSPQALTTGGGSKKGPVTRSRTAYKAPLSDKEKVASYIAKFKKSSIKEQIKQLTQYCENNYIDNAKKLLTHLTNKQIYALAEQSSDANKIVKTIIQQASKERAEKELDMPVVPKFPPLPSLKDSTATFTASAQRQPEQEADVVGVPVPVAN